jgi:hypothetical protein
MDTLQQLIDSLHTREEQHEIGQTIIKKNINSALLTQAEENIVDIKKNYDAGFLTLTEMINLRLDALTYLNNSRYILDKD